MLKGYLALKGGEIIKTHDLIILNKFCITHNSRFSVIMDFCIDLVDYSVNVRYPYHIEISNEDVNLAINNAEKILKFIISII